MATFDWSALASLWLQVGGAPEAGPLAASVAMAESSGNPGAVSNTGDVGLWQINWFSHSTYNFDRLKDPLYNARAAKEISGNGASWRAWCTAWTDGACGTKGGHYAPTGDSPSGRFYQQHPLAIVGPKHRSGHTGRRTIPSGQAAVDPQHVNMLTAWEDFTYELATGIPTQMQWTRNVYRRFIPSLRVSRLGP